MPDPLAHQIIHVAPSGKSQPKYICIYICCIFTEVLCPWVRADLEETTQTFGNGDCFIQIGKRLCTICRCTRTAMECTPKGSALPCSPTLSNTSAYQQEHNRIRRGAGGFGLWRRRTHIWKAKRMLTEKSEHKRIQIFVNSAFQANRQKPHSMYSSYSGSAACLSPYSFPRINL